MGTTNKGIPYPESTDPVAAGADAIKATAQAVNQPLTGVVTIPITGGTSGSVPITFPGGYFTAPPKVMATVNGGWGSNPAFAAASGITANGCTIAAMYRDSTAVTMTLTVAWLAVA